MAHIDEYVVKLVRDRIGEAIGPPRDFYYRAVDDHDQHVKLLRQKLGEEVIEYLLDPSLGELADVLQAIEDLAVVDLGQHFDDVLTAAMVKAEERGGFAEGTVMIAAAFEDGSDG